MKIEIKCMLQNTCTRKIQTTEKSLPGYPMGNNWISWDI